MKKLLVTTAAVLAAALNTYAQGQGSLSFNNIGAPDSKKMRGMFCEFCDGATYAIALYWGPPSATDDRNLVQIGGSATFLTDENAGYFFGGGRTITTPGSSVNGPVLAFQVRLWATASGTTYESANANGGFATRGPIFTMKTKDLTNPLETTPSIWQAPGFTGFVILSCPEPSTIALGILGAGSLLLFRRKRR